MIALTLLWTTSAPAADGQVGVTVGTAGLGIVAGGAVLTLAGGWAEVPEVWIPALGAMQVGYGMAAFGSNGAGHALRRSGGELKSWHGDVAVVLACTGFAVEIGAGVFTLLHPVGADHDDKWFRSPAIAVNLSVLPVSAAFANHQLDRAREVRRGGVQARLLPMPVRGGAGLTLVLAGSGG